MSELAHIDPVSRWHSFRDKTLIACIWLLFAIGYLWVTFGSAQTKVGEPAALIFPPHWSTQRMLQSTLSLDVALIDIGRGVNIAIVAPLSETALDTARSKGVLVILNAAGAALCARTL